LLNVGFNQEVAQDAAVYWTKEDGNLASLIEHADEMSIDKIQAMSEKAKSRIQSAYSWKYIADKYEKVFLERVESFCIQAQGKHIL
jgi:rhamnosyltransferase